MDSNKYPHLFSPFQLGSLTLPNRTVMAPMSTNLGSMDGDVTPQQIAFYRERATGGTGMIIVEFCCVQRSTGRSEVRQLSLESPTQLAGHQRLVEAITSAGSIACLQLQHGGTGVKRSLVEGGVAVGPSDVFSRKNPSLMTARGLTTPEIEELIECFGRTAELGVKAGYQAFELHGAHGYLLTAFLSPFFNHRDDEWGGDEDRRLNFPRRVIERVKEAIGDRPLSYRISAEEFTPHGNSIEDMERIAPKLVSYGVDALHVSIGLGATSFDKIIEPMSMPEGWRLPYAKRIKNVVDVPVIAVGQIRQPETAEQGIADGSCDLIALGRPLLADPEWANKAKNGGDIRPCTSCNYCVALADSEFGRIGCAENPRTGRELDLPLSAGAMEGETAVVVGGGPGGMAASLMLQRAGFNVDLFEARKTLGGGLIASAAPPHKEKFNWYQDYLKRQLAQSNIHVHVDQPATFEEIQRLSPRIVLLANGGKPLTLDIKGLEHPNVLDAYELLMGVELDLPSPDGGTVVVYGGGETGCECAEYLAERGYNVTLITRSPASKLARSAEMIYRGVLLKRLHENPAIQIVDSTQILRIEADGEVFIQTGEEPTTSIQTSRVFIAQGRRPDSTLSNQLIQAEVPFVSIGDARQGGRIGDAVHDAYLAIQGLCAVSAQQKPLAC